MSVIWWARRDLRLADNPALRAAAESGDVLAVFILDPQLLGSAPRPRDAWLAANVLDLDRQLDGRLCLKSGAPEQVLVELAQRVGATEVHVARETTPFGRRRDTSVSAELAKIGVDWIETGSPYAVTPGRITKSDGSAYRVFTAFERRLARAPLAPPRPAANQPFLGETPRVRTIKPRPIFTRRVRSALRHRSASRGRGRGPHTVGTLPRTRSDGVRRWS